MSDFTIRSAGIAEAAAWRLIGALFERPRQGWHAEIAALGAEARDATLRAVAATAADATEGDYLSLLGPGGAVSPREVTYQPFADPGHLLAELATTYEAFAFRPRAEDPIDHIAVEASFVAYLLLKEAYAAARGEDAYVTTTAAARAAFIAAHVSVLGAALADRLETASPSYLLATARLLGARLPARPPVPLPSSLDLPDLCGACTTEVGE